MERVLDYGDLNLLILFNLILQRRHFYSIITQQKTYYTVVMAAFMYSIGVILKI